MLAHSNDAEVSVSGEEQNAGKKPENCKHLLAKREVWLDSYHCLFIINFGLKVVISCLW